MRQPLSLRIGVWVVCALCISARAQAWDPNAGAEPTSAYNGSQRYYSNRALSPLPAPAAYAPQATYNTAPTATYPAATPYYAPPVAPVQPVVNSTIAPPPTYSTYQPVAGVAPAPIQAAVVPPVQVMPAAAPTYTAQPIPVVAQAAPAAPMAQAYMAEPAADTRPTYRYLRNRYSIGAELFYDSYREPDTFPDLHNKAYYGALNASMTRDINASWFTGLDGRVSYGSEKYSSNSGTIKNVPQWELESRVVTGYNGLFSDGSRLQPYIGLGARYYLDQSGGKTTDLGNFGYDRSILQFYMPIGLSYTFEAYGFTVTPNAELDPLLYGYVESRLSGIAGGYEDVKNIQDSGLGWRAEIMVSKLRDNGTGWQFGPFVRYWGIDDSNVDRYQSPSGPSAGIEPKNTRLQTGAKLKYLF